MGAPIDIVELGVTEDGKQAFGGTINLQINPENLDANTEYNFCVKVTNTNNLKYVTGEKEATKSVAWFQLNSQGTSPETPVITPEFPTSINVDWLDPENNEGNFNSVELKFDASVNVLDNTEAELSYYWEIENNGVWEVIIGTDELSIDVETNFLRVKNINPNVLSIKHIRLKVVNTITEGENERSVSAYSHVAEITLREKQQSIFPRATLNVSSPVKIPLTTSNVEGRLSAIATNIVLGDTGKSTYQWQILQNNDFIDIEEATGTLGENAVYYSREFSVDDLNGSASPFEKNSYTYRVKITNSEKNKYDSICYSNQVSLDILPVNAEDPVKVSLELREHKVGGQVWSGPIFQNGITQGYDVRLEVTTRGERNIVWYLRYEKCENGVWSTIGTYTLNNDPNAADNWTEEVSIVELEDSVRVRVKIDDELPGQFRYILWATNNIADATGNTTSSMPSPDTTSDETLWAIKNVLIQQNPYVNVVALTDTNVFLTDTFVVEFRYRNLTGPFVMSKTMNWSDGTTDTYVINPQNPGTTPDYNYYRYTENEFRDGDKQLTSITYKASEPTMNREINVVPFIPTGNYANVIAPIYSLVAEAYKPIRNLELVQKDNAYFRVEYTEGGNTSVLKDYNDDWGRANRNQNTIALNDTIQFNTKTYTAIRSNGRTEVAQDVPLVVEPFVVTLNFNGDEDARQPIKIPVSSVYIIDNKWLYGTLGDNLNNITDPTKEGFGFIGWFNDVEATVGVVQATSATPFTSNPSTSYSEIYAPSTLYARWGARITFDANGGQNSQTDNGTSITVTANIQGIYNKSKAYRPGYNFLGWFTAQQGGTLVNTSTYVFTGPTTLYAQWENATPSLDINLTVDSVNNNFTLPNNAISLNNSSSNKFIANITNVTDQLGRGLRFKESGADRIISGKITSPSGTVYQFINVQILNAQNITGLFSVQGQWLIEFTGIYEYAGGPQRTINMINIGY